MEYGDLSSSRHCFQIQRAKCNNSYYFICDTIVSYRDGIQKLNVEWTPEFSYAVQKSMQIWTLFVLIFNRLSQLNQKQTKWSLLQHKQTISIEHENVFEYWTLVKENHCPDSNSILLGQTVRNIDSNARKLISLNFSENL